MLLHLFTFILDPVKKQAVLELYQNLELPKYYATYKEESYKMLKTKILQTSHGLPHGIFLEILNKFFYDKN